MPTPDTEIAIVGAGAAGIGAALTAQAHGRSFRLIEARQRTGGRTWTTTTPLGRPFDLGASWIHAADAGNPFAELALARRADPLLDQRRRVVLDATGQPVGAAARAAFHAARAQGIARIEQAPPGASLADCLPGPEDEALGTPAEASAGTWAWTVRSFAGPWLCGTACAATDAADWAAAREGADWLLPRGYGTLVQELAEGLPATTDCVLDSLEVRPEAVRLLTTRGAFTARHVVLTVPLGVLAAGRIRFAPTLPDAWLEALEGLPMGCLMKVAIDLLDDPLDGLAGPADTIFLHYPASDERAVLYLIRPCGHPMAYAFVGGDMARALEPESDAAIRDVVLEPLRRLLGGDRVARSFGPAVASRWAADPLALGSYAVALPGRAAARAVLAEPLLGRVHLAGEATAPDGWHGTAGGAWLAGRAAVARIAGVAA
jgi:monoamine oxidase